MIWWHFTIHHHVWSLKLHPCVCLVGICKRYISSQLHVQCHHMTSLKSAVLGVLIPWKLANSTVRPFPFSKVQVVTNTLVCLCVCVCVCVCVAWADLSAPGAWKRSLKENRGSLTTACCSGGVGVWFRKGIQEGWESQEVEGLRGCYPVHLPLPSIFLSLNQFWLQMSHIVMVEILWDTLKCIIEKSKWYVFLTT